MAYLLYRCRVFMSIGPGQSVQRTKGNLLSANDVPGNPATLLSDGSLQTVVIKVWRLQDRRGDDIRDWTHGMMRAFPSCSKYVRLFVDLASPPNHIFTANDIRNFACFNQHPIHDAEGPMSGLPRAGMGCTHLVAI